MLKKITEQHPEKQGTLLTRKGLKIALLSFWCLTLASLIIAYFALQLSLAEMATAIRAFISRQGIWGPALYILFYSFRSLVFFPASLLTILSGLLFGPWHGFLFTMIGENISANISFLAGRYFTPDLGGYLNRHNPFISRLLQCSQENGFITVLFMRLAYAPFDLVGYGSGICRIKQRDFALGTFLGTIPGLLTFILLGGAVADQRLLAFSLLTFLVSFFIAQRLKKSTPACFQPPAPTVLP